VPQVKATGVRSPRENDIRRAGIGVGKASRLDSKNERAKEKLNALAASQK
jgi:hypothetical protein